jgi:benzoyl-CoA-dihydrodiol lyase
MARELDDAILCLRTNELDIGIWLLKTEGDANAVLAVDAAMMQHMDNWFVRETIGMLRRTFARIDVSSRSVFALIEPGSCFAGTLFELALAADRSYMLSLPSNADAEPRISLSQVNFGTYPMVNAQPRLAHRFYDDSATVDAARATIGTALTSQDAVKLGLITAAPDDLDWADEIRIAIEERASMSPDALTGLEANLRFGGKETMESRIFGRLSAWQNWIFIRPNATGEKGALKVYGKGVKSEFDWNRV